jgi:phosphatidate cytidylyltransferase
MGTLLVLALAVGLWADECWGRTAAARLPAYPCWLVISLAVVTLGCRELLELFRHRDIRTSPVLAYVGVVGVTVSNWTAIPTASQPAGGGLITGSNAGLVFIAVCLAGMAMLLREAWVYREPGHATTSMAGGVLAVFYLGVLASFLIQLRWQSAGLLALAMHIAASKCGDIGAYFGGRALGRTKLCPRLSPNKTVEGAVCGLVASVVGAIAVDAVGPVPVGRWFPMTFLAAGIFGLAVGVAAQVGDLVESLIKRDCQQKDASNIVPGFGGILDVLDSPLFAAPVGYFLWNLFGPAPAP